MMAPSSLAELGFLHQSITDSVPGLRKYCTWNGQTRRERVLVAPVWEQQFKSQHPCKKTGMVTYTGNSSIMDTETWIPRAHRPANLVWIGSSDWEGLIHIIKIYKKQTEVEEQKTNIMCPKCWFQPGKNLRQWVLKSKEEQNWVENTIQLRCKKTNECIWNVQRGLYRATD